MPQNINNAFWAKNYTITVIIIPIIVNNVREAEADKWINTGK